MSDEKLRELERRWRESGTVEDEAAFLRERVRVGDVDHERLELAAFLLHPAAVEVLGEKAPAPTQELGRLLYLIVAKNSPPREPAVRALVRTAWFQLARQNGEFSFFPDGVLERQLAWLEAWCLAPAGHTRRTVARGLRTMLNSHRRVFVRRGGPSPRDLAAEAVSGASNMVVTGAAEELKGSAANAVRSASGRLSYPAPPEGEEIDYERGTAEHCELREAICSELVPWALGYGDPVRDRVEARKAAGD